MTWLTDFLDDLKCAAVWTGALVIFALLLWGAIEVAYGCPGK